MFMRLARVPPPKNPSGLWSAKHNGSTVKVGQIRLLLKEPNGAGGEAMTFDWTPDGEVLKMLKEPNGAGGEAMTFDRTPDGEVLKMNAACRRPRIKCLGCRAI
jgi:hypothetical protein